MSLLNLILIRHSVIIVLECIKQEVHMMADLYRGESVREHVIDRSLRHWRC